jgi:serine/threonine protein kinase/tetratricopeptide (TPR) repeat protein
MIGRTLGHYRIVEKVGAGGMGEVYRAHDEQLDRDVALKVLPSGTIANEAARKQFRKEALALAKLNHPNIETIFEFGSQDAIDFLAMELIAGYSISEKLKEGPLPQPEVLRLGAQLAEGLAAAHDQDIIHRDLKPGNLFVTPDGRLKILDFGLAKFIHPNLLVDATQSIELEQGEISGTVPYMSPEQLRGLPVDPRSDIYAAGAVLYEMATGAKSFPQTQGAELMGAILHKTPPSPRTVNPHVSTALEHVVTQALEKEPSQRYQSARELRVALEALSGDFAPEPKPRKGPDAVTKSVLVAVSAIVVAGVLWGVNFHGLHDRIFARHSVEPAKYIVGPTMAIKARRSLAVLGFRNLSGRSEDAWLSTAFSEMLTTELAAGEKLRTVPGESVAQMKIDLSLPDSDSYGPETLAQIHKHLNSDQVVTGAYIRLNKSQVRLDLRLQDAIAGETLATVSETGSDQHIDDLVGRAGSALREKLGIGAVTDAEATALKASLPSNPEAARLYSEGLTKLRAYDVLGAKELLLKAVAAEPHSAPAHAALASAWLGLGYDREGQKEGKAAFDLSKNLGLEDRLWIEAQYRESLREWDHAIEIYRTLFGSFPDNLDYGLRLARAQIFGGKIPDALITVETLRALPPPARDDPQIDLTEGLAAGFMGDFKRQRAASVRAVEKGKARGAKGVVARALLNECQALTSLNELKEAVFPCQEAVRIYGDAGDRVDSARALIYYGVELDNAGDAVSARAKEEEALDVFRKAGFMRGIANALNDIAIIQEDQGDLRGAIRNYAEAGKINRDIGNTLTTSAEVGNTGDAFRKLGRFAESREAFEEALAIDREKGNKRNQAVWYENYSSLLFVQGDLGGAQKMLDQMDALLRENPDPASSAGLLSSRARIFFVEGDLDAAKAKYQHTIELGKQSGDEDSVAQGQVELARIAIEEGRTAEAEGPCREALAVFRAARDSDKTVWAGSVIALAFLTQGKVADAQSEMDAFAAYLAKSQNYETNIPAAIMLDRIRAAAGRPAEALKNMEGTITEAHKLGFIPFEFEARLAQGEIEMKSGRSAAGRAHLSALDKDATAKGFLLIARKTKAAGGKS